MICVGFSTHSGNVVSRLIRWMTGSKASHTWLLVDDALFGTEMVMEATEVGFRFITYSRFKAEGNDIVTVVTPAFPLKPGMRQAAMWLGERYDFGGLLGSAVVLLGRWLRRKWKNPLGSSKAMFCSEAVVRVMQAAGYPGSAALDPESITPQDLLDFLTKVGA